MRIGIIQSEPAHLDPKLSCTRLAPQIEACVAEGAEIVVLPELAGSGYLFPNLEALSGLAEPADGSGLFLNWLIQRCKEHDIAIVSGYAEVSQGTLFNSAAFLTPKGVRGNYRKLHLFDTEKELFQPGDAGVPVFEWRGAKFSILICFDWSFPEVWRMAALAGADFVAHCSNLVLPWAQTGVKGHALCNHIGVFTANRIGTESQGDTQVTFTGGSQAITPTADLLASAPRAKIWQGVFEFEPSLARNKQVTGHNHLFEDRRRDMYSL
ncbi:MAG TPA: nitrilase-related carbon-nitrogen hydrolase [Planctomycetota bacterium]|nr:nitrilase-related carbon-nitrogen hydrolase [Planctomycetota bacterium]